MEAEKEQLQTQLADVEALRIMPLYKSIDDLTAVIAARDGSIAEHQSSAAGLQTQIAQLVKRLESKRGKKQAYKTAFVGKVGSNVLFDSILCIRLSRFGECKPSATVWRQMHLRCQVAAAWRAA